MTTTIEPTEVTAAFEAPRMVQLGKNVYAACFTLMKIIPARFMLRRAAEAGAITDETVLVETTSGTFGLALAMQAALMRRRLVLVGDSAIDERLHRRLIDLGAVVERVPEAAASSPGGYQAARLARVDEVRSRYPSTYCPMQYSNPDNPCAYVSVAEHLVDCLGEVDCLVGPVGSGGSMCGTARYLRSVAPECRAVAVDTFGSVLFGQQDKPRALRGLGMSIRPANLEHSTFDEVHWCSAAAAYQATRELHQRHALFMGPTSGAAYLVGRWWADRNPDALTVILMPDEGHRYIDTVYNDEWLIEQGYAPTELPGEPAPVADPTQAQTPWAVCEWGRRTYDEFFGTDGSS